MVSVPLFCILLAGGVNVVTLLDGQKLKDGICIAQVINVTAVSTTIRALERKIMIHLTMELGAAMTEGTQIAF